MKTSFKIRCLADILLFLFFCFSFLTGLALYFLPDGPRSGRFLFLGFLKHQWASLHNFSSLILVFLGALHLFFYRKVFSQSIKSFFKKSKPGQNK